LSNLSNTSLPFHTPRLTVGPGSVTFLAAVECGWHPNADRLLERARNGECDLTRAAATGEVVAGAASPGTTATDAAVYK